jgi:hypothetical protein
MQVHSLRTWRTDVGRQWSTRVERFVPLSVTRRGPACWSVAERDAGERRCQIPDSRFRIQDPGL